MGSHEVSRIPFPTIACDTEQGLNSCPGPHALSPSSAHGGGEVDDDETFVFVQLCLQEITRSQSGGFIG